jgi:hypothetical protein
MFWLGGKVRLNAVLRSKPVSEKFGFDRGTPLDRYYIERFLGAHAHRISGRVLEVAESNYTRKFGTAAVAGTVLRYKGDEEEGVMIGDLTEHAGLPENVYDCFICTQTYNFIYDFQKAIAGSYRLLKPGGALLATVAALSPVSKYDADRWGDFWRFTPQSSVRMFTDVFGSAHVSVHPFGNSAVAALFMKGYSVEDLPSMVKPDEHDPDYPIVIGICAVK